MEEVPRDSGLLPESSFLEVTSFDVAGKVRSTSLLSVVANLSLLASGPPSNFFFKTLPKISNIVINLCFSASVTVLLTASFVSLEGAAVSLLLSTSTTTGIKGAKAALGITSLELLTILFEVIGGTLDSITRPFTIFS